MEQNEAVIALEHKFVPNDDLPEVKIFELADGDAILEVRGENTGTSKGSFAKNPLNTYQSFLLDSSQ